MRDTMFHTTTTRLSFWNRVKVLLGRPVIVKSEIDFEVDCEAEYFGILKQSAYTSVPPLIPRAWIYSRPRGEGEIQHLGPGN